MAGAPKSGRLDRWYSIFFFLWAAAFLVAIPACDGKTDKTSGGPSMSPSVTAPSPTTPTPAPTPDPTPAPDPIPPHVKDFQGDLMVYVPELAPRCPEDPVTHIRCGNAAGIQQGWVWSLTLYRYPKDQRQVFYDAAKRQGKKDVAIEVACDPRGDGYHGLLPIDCNGAGGTPGSFNYNSGMSYGQLVQGVAVELKAQGFNVLCAGPSRANGLAWGFDPNLCDKEMTHWDDYADDVFCEIGLIHSTFPNGPVYYELPAGVPFPQKDACAPFQATATNGAQWVAAVKQRYPRFAGVLYEYWRPDGPGAAINITNTAHRFFGTAQEVLFETDTYQKFWNGMDYTAEQAYNDSLLSQLPFLKGCMSGCSPRAIVPDLFQVLRAPAIVRGRFVKEG